MKRNAEAVFETGVLIIIKGLLFPGAFALTSLVFWALGKEKPEEPVQVSPEETVQVSPEEPTARAWSKGCVFLPPEKLDAHIERASAEFEIDPVMLAVTVYRESGCRATARGQAGEVGLAQISPDVWVGELVASGVLQEEWELWVPEQNLRASAYILSSLFVSEKGDVRRTFQKYNGSGPRARRYGKEQAALYRSISQEP